MSVKFYLKSADESKKVDFTSSRSRPSKLLNNTVQAWIIVQEENEAEKNLVAESYYQQWVRKDKQVSPRLKELSTKLETGVPFTEGDLSFLEDVLLQINRATRLKGTELRNSSYYRGSPDEKQALADAEKRRLEAEERRRLDEERQRSFFVKNHSVEPRELSGGELREVLEDEKPIGKIISFFRKRK